jgi:thiamine biosynthesis lipoprotein
VNQSFLIMLGVLAVADPPRCREQSFYVMGTLARIEACGLEEPALDDAIGLAYRELETVDRLMSLYREESELSRLNRRPPGTPFALSPATFEVLAEAVRIAEESGGAFDPTVGPLLRLWGFYRGEGSVPTSSQLVDVGTKVGFRHIRLDPIGSSVRLGRAGVEIDLGALAKGYAVDRAIAALRKAGAAQGVVDLGESSIGLYGNGYQEKLFSVRNKSGSSHFLATFELGEGCLSTSAGDEKGFERDGEWFSHIIDPRTGWPVRDSLSATVVGKEGEAMKVDALSTAGFVAGPHGAVDLWERFGVEGILFYRKGGEIDSIRTSRFPLSSASSGTQRASQRSRSIG